MNYAEAQRDPNKNRVGLSVVVGLHVILAWAIVTGNAKKVVDVVKGPIETKIIEEVKPPPPPPPEKLPPPPPKNLPPPPAWVPPPEVNVQVQQAPTISTQSVNPPPVQEFKPAAATPPGPPTAPPAPPAPPARTAPSIRFGEADKPEYSPAARRAEIECEVVVAYVMETTGAITEANVEKSCGSSREHKQLDRATVDAVKAVRGKPGTVDGKPERLSGRVVYVWKLE